MTANINPDTNIPYGIIKIDAIDSDVLHDLLYVKGRDISYDAALEEHLAQKRREHEAAMEELAIKRAETGEDRENPNIGEDDPEFDEDFETQEFAEHYQCDEPVTQGEYQGVKYQTTWLGGALMLYVFESPVLTKCRPCSPCVPNAGDLDSTGDYLAYGVPVEWLSEDFVKEQCEAIEYEVSDSGAGPYWKKVEDDTDDQSGTFSTDTEAWSDCYKINLQYKVGMTLDEIKAAVDSGKKVHWSNVGYDVIKGTYEYLIVYYGESAIGLTHQDGVTMNGRPGQFFTNF